MSKSLNEWLKTDVAEQRAMATKDPINYYGKEFHRDPLRPQIVDCNFMFSPADGTILYQKEVMPEEQICEIKGEMFTSADLLGIPNFNQKALVVGIFMSQYDVHVNRMPYSGILDYKEIPSITSKNRPMLKLEEDIFEGTPNHNAEDYLFVNSRSLNTVSVPRLNYKFYMVQIGDQEVDVITHFYPEGKALLQNTRFGGIRYGSQVDLVLPIPCPFDYTLLLKDTDHVEAGVDAILKLDFKC